MIGLQERVDVRAYELWEQAGSPEGRSDEFWFAAESEFEDPANEPAPVNEELATLTRSVSDLSR
jgi:hypothetical protein